MITARLQDLPRRDERPSSAETSVDVLEVGTDSVQRLHEVALRVIVRIHVLSIVLQRAVEFWARRYERHKKRVSLLCEPRVKIREKPSTARRGSLGTERFDAQIYAAPLWSRRRPSSLPATLRKPRMWFDVAIVGQVADPAVVAA